MKAIRVIVPLLLVATIIAAIVVKNHSHGPPISTPQPTTTEQPVAAPDSQPVVSDIQKAPTATLRGRDIAPAPAPENTSPGTNKLDRLIQTQELFRRLAAGDKLAAMRAAKQITNEVERETALFTLVTEWTQGELDSPKRRAYLISTYGLEAGLGFELANQPELALAWANELTEGPARTDLVQAVARGMVGSDSAAAFALTEQVPEADRRKFSDALLGYWASQDTAAAMQWAEQFPDPADRDAALQTIRAVAPTGIGAAVVAKDGHPVINELVPGTPAALSGQLVAGDRILAIAQGNNQYVDVQNLPLANVVDMIRGAAGTPVQLQVVAADAPPNSLPRIVTIYRDQIKFKR
jgi:hypothetical protein